MDTQQATYIGARTLSGLAHLHPVVRMLELGLPHFRRGSLLGVRPGAISLAELPFACKRDLSQLGGPSEPERAGRVYLVARGQS